VLRRWLVLLILLTSGCASAPGIVHSAAVPDVLRFTTSAERIELGDKVLLTLQAWNNGTSLVPVRIASEESAIGEFVLPSAAGKLIEKSIEWTPQHVGRYFVKASIGETERVVQVVVDGAVITDVSWKEGRSVWDDSPYLDLTFKNAGSTTSRITKAAVAIYDSSGILVVNRTQDAGAVSEGGSVSFAKLPVKVGTSYSATIYVFPRPGEVSTTHVPRLQWS